MRIIDIAIRKLINGKTGGAAALIFALILSFTAFSGRILSDSLFLGANNLKERLGADIAVVPKGEEESYQGIILSGEPVECSIERSLESKLIAIDGVEKVTPVVYLASLNASCCSVPIQIIGYDPETDFVTTPWISEGYVKDNKDGSLIIGYNIAADSEDTLTFFGRSYEIRARLNKTGTGMDKSVYVTFDVVEQLIKDAKEKGVSFGEKDDITETDRITDSYVSAFLIRVKEGYSSDQVTGTILRDIPAGVVQSKNVFSSVTEGIGVISDFIRNITIAVLFIVSFVTALLHIYRVENRRKEWAVYRMMGASGNWILELIFTETVLLSIVGAVAGVGLGALVVFPFSELISEQLKLPYLRPDLLEIIKGVLFSIGLTAFSSIIPGIIAGEVAAGTECYVLMREGES